MNLFTRPRRFGKSLNMSMLKAFFEIGCDKTLFDGLAISEETALCEAYMGKFPVVSISLKGIDAGDYETARGLAVKIINEEARRLNFLLESEKLSSEDKKLLSDLLKKEMDDETLICSLRELSELLHKHYEKKVIILNLRVLSITSVRFDKYLGFTDYEVRNLLEYYDLTDKYTIIKEWYDGYLFGNVNVYCPWDVINYCDELTACAIARPKDYWSNTSGNDAVRHFLEGAGAGATKGEIESLVAGETVTKEIHEDLTYNRLYDSIDNIWSLLFTTGYLTQRGRADGKLYQLAIPNREIRNIFTEQIMKMFREDVANDGEALRAFCAALQSGDAAETERLFTLYLGRTISIRDTSVRKERKESFPPGKATTKGSKRQNPSVCFYHGILLGILGFRSGWIVRSNAESGDAYSDILVEIDSADTGIIIEVKYAEKAAFAAPCREAMAQIETTGYTARLKDEGFHTIYKYGIACFRKRCRVVCEKETIPEEE